MTRGAFAAGDLLRLGARTARETLPRPRHVSATEALSLAPCLRVDGLRGGILGWDGQLEDDARLVVNIARTAASYGAHVRTHVRVLAADGGQTSTRVRLRDELTGVETEVAARHGRQRHRRVGRRARAMSACGRAAAATSCCAGSRCPDCGCA